MTDLFTQVDDSIVVDDTPKSRWRAALAFPDPVNEYAARTTAGLVIVLAAAAIAVNQWWLYALLAVGFALRVAGGPRYSPFGRLAVHVIVPTVVKRTRSVPGPPKRFAQAVGLVFSAVALGLSLAGLGTAAQIVTGALIAAAFLECVFGFCLGCVMFGFLQRAGVVPASACQTCHRGS
ncbi:MAG: DUF4395 domain-containing protein [Gordonia sp. (in: high G+C Gram-positive bacteria)]|uniref:DUF4395 domain-containing protein n=1 Tax=Gordonia sp. (in: high G+C Gram-positive bacteria) TaxID=84139 RepID=UPI0039E3740E